MIRFLQISITTIGILTLLIVLGCSNNDPTSTEENTSSAITNVYPANGSIDLSPKASVSVVFTNPVDTMSVMSNFHLAGGTLMNEWLDSLDHFGGLSMMGMSQQDHMMNWIDSIHVTGTFHWNNNRDSCEFTPNKQLDPNTDYLCVLNETGMQDHQGGMMGGEGHDNDNDIGFHMFGFSTGN